MLPDAIHNALPAHHPGLVITDISIAQCSSLNLLSSCKLDSSKWHRIDKDLYLSRGWVSHAYLHIARKREEDLKEGEKVIFDVRVGRLNPGSSGAKGINEWESRPGGIWLKRSAKRHASDSEKAVTAVDVLFGADAVDPRSGWKILDQQLSLSNLGDNPVPRISIRQGHPPKVVKPPLHVNKNGKFKILQVADLHLSTGLGTCRDAEPASIHGEKKCEADPRTLEFVSSVLDLENPDLVVLSGDQVNGDTAPDAQTAIFKFVELFISRKIPFACIFGNHDDEGTMSREDHMELLNTLPYSLSETGPSSLDGIGNYNLEILARGHSHHSAATLYLLDTHAYSPDERNFRGYDWLKKSQIDWFRAKAQDLKRSPSHHQYSHTRMDMAFIHIPLPEYRNVEDISEKSGKIKEPPTAPGFNSGFKDALIEAGVLTVSCGHDHVNDYCALARSSEGEVKGEEQGKGHDPSLWMCYAGGSGLGGYGGYADRAKGYGPFVRRVRIYELDFNVARIDTWKRIEAGPEKDSRVDEMMLAEGGKIVAG